MEKFLMDVPECSVSSTKFEPHKFFNNFFFRAMLFIVGLPVSQIVLFALSIGHDPKGLPIAVKNYELDTINDGCHYIPGCNNTRLSCRYIKQLEDRSMVIVSNKI